MGRWMDLSICTVKGLFLLPLVSREDGYVTHLMPDSSLLPHTHMPAPELLMLSGVIKSLQQISCAAGTYFKDLAQGPKSCCRCDHHDESLVELLYNKSRGHLNRDLH